MILSLLYTSFIGSRFPDNRARNSQTLTDEKSSSVMAQTPEKFLEKMLLEAGFYDLNIVREGKAMAIDGISPNSDRQKMQDVLKQFEETVSETFFVVDNVLYDGPERRDPPIPKSIWYEAPMYVVLESGEKIFIGEMSVGGWILMEITHERVVFENHEGKAVIALKN